MKTKTIILIILIISFIILGVLARYLWIEFGGKYTRTDLIGTEYIENSDKLFLLEKDQKQKYYVIKKYKYSKYVWAPGYGGGVNRIDDYYDLGIAGADKQIILTPQYEDIFAVEDYKTKEVFTYCVPHMSTGLKTDFYRIENNKAILLPDTQFFRK